MRKQNCWEFKKCGRQLGGENVKELGICPAYDFSDADGFCDGTNGGRACAYIQGTFCGGKAKGNRKDKNEECAKCKFYKMLRHAHGEDMSVSSLSRHLKNKGCF